jgi:hypothetical protein
MFDVRQEPPLALPEAAAFFPYYLGRKLSLSTWYRLTTRGWRGVILESVQSGSVRSTSEAAIARFVQRCTELRETGRVLPVVRTVTQRERQSQAAAKELERLGL